MSLKKYKTVFETDQMVKFGYALYGFVVEVENRTFVIVREFFSILFVLQILSYNYIPVSYEYIQY